MRTTAFLWALFSSLLLPAICVHPLISVSQLQSGRCLPDVIIGGNGKVVVYDIVVSVSSSKLFVIGPHKKLWIVPETPHLQKETVFFPRYFERKHGESSGSFCSFSGAEQHNHSRNNRTSNGIEAVKSSMSFLHDPIENVNVAACDIPRLLMDQVLGGVNTQVTLNFLATNKEIILFRDLPICVAYPKPSNTMLHASLCCIMHNEARYLVEWIEYSRLIGIEHFFLYDHNSTDNTAEILGPYIAAEIVTWHNWSFPGYPQREAHSHCTHRYSHMTRWLGLVDIDEFIVPVKVDSIIPILQYFANDQVVLRLSAAMFGTSGHMDRPLGLVIASYTFKNISTRLPNNPQHKVFFRPGDNYVLLPSIHAVDIVTESTLQVDLHEHDIFYNHYRTKSIKDHSEDPLRSKLPITEASEIEDTTMLNRFLAKLQTRLYRSEGGRHPEFLDAESPQNNASFNVPSPVEVVASTLAQNFRGRYEECPRLAVALSQLLPKDRPVLDFVCGSGFYTVDLHLRGFDVVGLDSEGSVSQLLSKFNVTELDVWESFGPECKIEKRGHVICLGLEDIRWPDRIFALLENIVRCADGMIILNWPQAVSLHHLVEAMLVIGGFEMERSQTRWIQDQASLARSVTRDYLFAGLSISQCAGSSQLAAFTRSGRFDGLANLLANSHGDQFSVRILNPADGDILSNTARIRAVGLDLLLEFHRFPPGSRCAAVFFDDELATRVCRESSQLPIRSNRILAGLHVITAVSVSVSSSSPGHLDIGGWHRITLWVDTIPSEFTDTEMDNRTFHTNNFLDNDSADIVSAAANNHPVNGGHINLSGHGDFLTLQPYELIASQLVEMAYTVVVNVTWAESAWTFCFFSPGMSVYTMQVLLPSQAQMPGADSFRLSGQDPTSRRCHTNASLTVRHVPETPHPAPVSKAQASRELDLSLAAFFCSQPDLALPELLPSFLRQIPRLVSSSLRRTVGDYMVEQLRLSGDNRVFFRLIDPHPRKDTVDWIYVRAVGPAIVVARISHLGEGEYLAALQLPLAGTYVVQVVRAWAGLPARVASQRSEEAAGDDAVLGLVGTQTDVVAALSDPASVAGHISVERPSRQFLERRLCGNSGGLREGLWVDTGGGSGVWNVGDASRAGENREDGPAGIDECPVVQGAWQWQPFECKQVPRQVLSRA